LAVRNTRDHINCETKSFLDVGKWELHQLDAVKTNCGRNRMLTICQYV